MNKIHEWVNTLLIAVVLILVLVGANQSAEPKNIGAGTRMPNGISADSTSPVAGEVRGTTLNFSGAAEVGNFVRGGSSLATTTNGAGTFTAAQVCDNNLIVATPNVGAVTLTFPSTAQLIADCLPTVGDEKTIRLYNATSTTGAASVLTLADGANGDHQEEEGATTVVEGTEWAEITFMNIDGTNHLMFVTVTQIAD